jgi:hypothetical protein
MPSWQECAVIILKKDTQPTCTPEEEEEDLQAMVLGIL